MIENGDICRFISFICENKYQPTSLSSPVGRLKDFVSEHIARKDFAAEIPEHLLKKRSIIEVFTSEENEKIIEFLKNGESSSRNKAIGYLHFETGIRAVDLLRLTWDDVYDFANARMRSHMEIAEKKTGKSKLIALNGKVVIALTSYIPAARSGAFLFENAATGKAISRIQAYRLTRAAAEALRFSERVSCHSLRKTFGYHAWKSGVALPVIMDIYNHSSLAVTRRYLGVTQDDKDAVYLGLDLAV